MRYSRRITERLRNLAFANFKERHKIISALPFASLVSPHFRLLQNTGHCPSSVVQGINRFQFQRYSTMSCSSITALEGPAQLAKQIFGNALESVKPTTLLKEKIRLEGDSILKIHEGGDSWKTVNLKSFRNVVVVGFGKAVLPMAEYVKTLLGNRVTKCMVNIPNGFRDSRVEGIEICRGAKNNYPDEDAFTGTRNIVQVVQDCDPSDLLIVLITGGGSALFEYPLHPITIEEMKQTVQILSRSGATIEELNIVRKRLSLVKGGGLLTLSQSSTIIGLILSDVMGDPLDLIASGPTVPNPDSENIANEVIRKYLGDNEIPTNILKALEIPVIVPPRKDVTNIIIGSNAVAIQAAALAAEQLNLSPFPMTSVLSGEASTVGGLLGDIASAISYLFIRNNSSDQQSKGAYIQSIRNTAEILKFDPVKTQNLIEGLERGEIQKSSKGVCLIFGGETTVTVSGRGVGGRNQELALGAGIKLDSVGNHSFVKGKVAVLSAGTDGFDGPCDGAGAVVDSTTVSRGYHLNLKASDYIKNNDSYNYFKTHSNGLYHIITGHTETNVMDLVLVVVVANHANKL